MSQNHLELAIRKAHERENSRDYEEHEDLNPDDRENDTCRHSRQKTCRLGRRGRRGRQGKQQRRARQDNLKVGTKQEMQEQMMLKGNKTRKISKKTLCQEEEGGKELRMAITKRGAR